MSLTRYMCDSLSTFVTVILHHHAHWANSLGPRHYSDLLYIPLDLAIPPTTALAGIPAMKAAMLLHLPRH